MQVWNVLYAAYWKYRKQKLHKKLPSAHHRTTLSGYVFATKTCIDNRKKHVKQQYLLHMSSQYGELQPTNGWDPLAGLGHPANFNVFRVLASLQHRHRSTEVNQTLHNVWPFPGLVHYIYIFGGSCPLTNSARCKNSLCIQVLRSPILAALLHTALAQWASAKLCGVVQGIELQNFHWSF